MAASADSSSTTHPPRLERMPWRLRSGTTSRMAMMRWPAMEPAPTFEATNYASWIGTTRRLPRSGGKTEPPRPSGSRGTPHHPQGVATSRKLSATSEQLCKPGSTHPSHPPRQRHQSATATATRVLEDRATRVRVAQPTTVLEAPRTEGRVVPATPVQGGPPTMAQGALRIAAPEDLPMTGPEGPRTAGRVDPAMPGRAAPATGSATALQTTARPSVDSPHSRASLMTRFFRPR